jgi:hypothetical protein
LWGSENAQSGNFLIRAFGTDNGCKAYLGTVRVLRNFIEKYADIVHPINELTKNITRSKVDQAQKTFDLSQGFRKML